MESWQLEQLQGLPLGIKIEKTKLRIREWYEHWSGDVYVSYSGGKDSIVLLDIARSMYPEIKAVFCDTGLEYPEIKEQMTNLENLITIRPSKSFREVISEFGYPVVSKQVAGMLRDLNKNNGKNDATKNLILTGYTQDGRFLQRYKLPNKWHFLTESPFKISSQCCDELKKKPFKKFEKQTGLHPILGVMADEGGWRKKDWLDSGCNAFDSTRPKSSPMAFWKESDVIEYIKVNNLKYPSVYGDIIYNMNGNYCFSKLSRTGCIFCLFGMSQESVDENRFRILKNTHPKLYDYCMKPFEDGGLGIKKVLDFLGVKIEE